MDLKIRVIDKKTSLSLWEKGLLVDEIEISENKKISQEILPKLDALLKKNELKLKSLKKINFDSNISSNFTTNRIAQIVRNILAWHQDRAQLNLIEKSR